MSLADKASNGERLLILATEAGANNNPAKQKEYLDQLVAAYPNDERAHFNLGGYYFGQQDYPQAIEHYRKATEIDPSYSTAYNLLGYAYRQSGDYANAEKAFQKYIELIPKDPNPYDSYAELLLEDGPVRRVDRAVPQGAGDRPELPQRAPGNRDGPPVLGKGGAGGGGARQHHEEGADRRRAPERRSSR